jgi:hypothetical protein
MKAGNTVNPLNAELNPISHLLALLGTRHILHVSRIRVKKLVLSNDVDEKGFTVFCTKISVT